MASPFVQIQCEFNDGTHRLCVYARKRAKQFTIEYYSFESIEFSSIYIKSALKKKKKKIKIKVKGKQQMMKTVTKKIEWNCNCNHETKTAIEYAKKKGSEKERGEKLQQNKRKEAKKKTKRNTLEWLYFLSHFIFGTEMKK